MNSTVFSGCGRINTGQWECPDMRQICHFLGVLCIASYICSQDTYKGGQEGLGNEMNLPLFQTTSTIRTLPHFSLDREE